MKKTHPTNPWIFCPKPNPTAQLRLFCFPYAGRGASLFRNWSDSLSPQLEMCAIQLPGRENRLGERLFNRIADVVQMAAQNFRPFLDKPFALFGHSMGAVICFELARRLRSQYEVSPVHLFISAHRAPQMPDPNPPIRHLPDEEFIAEIQHRYDGIPREVMQNPDLLELLLPTLRADVEMLETYTYEPERPLACPITAFGGREDPEASYEELTAWRVQTQGSFEIEIFPGNHFFLQSAQPQILRAVSEDLTRSAGRSYREQK